MLNQEKPPRRRWRRLAAELLLFLALVAGIEFWRAHDMASGPAPAVAGRLADGREASLAETLRAANGRPVLLYVWGAWCPVCKLEEGTVAALAKDWPVLTVAMQSGGPEAVARHMKERGLDFPALVDERGEIVWAIGVRSVPAYFVVDPKGLIRFSGAGFATGWGLRLRLWWAGTIPPWSRK